MTQTVYITRSAAFLPNEPVSNEQMEAVLGSVGGRASRARAVVLRRNGIRQRHYAIDPASGRTTHSNALLTAEAVRGLVHQDFELAQIQLLACGTSSPDQLAPNHAVMVHGELANPPCEVMAASGICVSGVMSLKYAWLSVLSGQVSTAVATGSEVASSFMRAGNFEAEAEDCEQALERRPVLAFEQDFLRWMLSDGAGALLLRDRPAARGLSLQIEWIDQFSFANELPPCMYAGAEKGEDGRLTGWRELGAGRADMTFRQDVRLLESGIRKASRQGFEAMLARRGLAVDEVDWLLPHYSSEYFRPVMYEVMPEQWKIPQERWFTNLAHKGNVGSASLYLLIDELLASGRLRAGHRLLGYVPESGRFSTAFVYMRVVAA